MELLRLEGLTKRYVSGTEVLTILDKVDLSIPAGSVTVFTGESGSGKSTLLNIIGALDNPDSGQIRVDGIRVDQLAEAETNRYRSETVGFVFQFHYLLPEFTARENVLMPYLINHGRADRRIRERADELFELAGISKVKNNLAPNMSGGQQQRTAIIRALINDPRIILADEPTGNLDTATTAAIYRLFRQINETYKTTFIIVTHDRKIAEQTDRIIEIKDGRIEMDVKK